MIKRYKPRTIQYFVWSPELAYAVGLITTDGCLSSNKRHIIFTSKDMEQIENFKSALGIKNAHGFTRNPRSVAYRIQYGNVQFYDWLLKIGLSQRKSLTLGPISVPDEYFIDFLRGHLDGDGSISTYTDFYNTKKNPKYIYKRLFVKFISASKDHIDWLHEKIIKNVGVKGAVHVSKITKVNQNPIHMIKFAKKESLILLSKIYYSDNILALSRKKILYEQYTKSLCDQKS